VKVSVIGAGAWGTTLSIILAEAGHDVSLWVYERELCEKMIDSRENSMFLPGFQVPMKIMITGDIGRAVENAAIILFAVPSKHLKAVASGVFNSVPRDAIIVSATKGLEEGTGRTMSQVLKDIYPAHRIAALSGPNLSKEIAKGLPAASVAACADPKAAEAIQLAFMLERFRVYTSIDVIGVELGGALKNIIAIAAGIVDGLGLGDNAKAGLMVRGIVEISRLGVAMGASPETFSGLSGMGDLITTCSSRLSRNHSVGESLAKGRCLKDILGGMKEVAEGVGTTKVALELAKKLKVEMPITQQVYNVLFDGVDPFKAITALMTREKKKE
jgi:glycerol-3-phosphate dehydrogenase (NAD(P)+)